MEMDKRTRIVFIAIAVVIVILLAFWWYLSSTRPVPMGTPAFAPSGQLTPGFPKGLVLDSLARVSQSYSINYSTSTNQYTVSFNSSSSVADIYNEYLAYLPANGWPITNKVTEYKNSRGLYAENASSVVSVAIVVQGSGSQVTVSYGTGVAGTATPQFAHLTVQQGTLVVGFPRKLVVDPSAKILSSSDNPDPASGTHTTAAIYQSSESVSTLYNQYLGLFSGASWQIMTKTNTSALATIFAENSSTKEQINVQIQGEAKGQTNIIVSSKVPNS